MKIIVTNVLHEDGPGCRWKGNDFVFASFYRETRASFLDRWESFQTTMFCNPTLKSITWRIAC